MKMLRNAILRSKEKDSILNEIANNVIIVTENHIQKDDILRRAFENGNPISISKSEFDGVLKMALKGAGYVRISDKMTVLSDKVINQLVDKGYRVGITNEGILLSKYDSEI